MEAKPFAEDAREIAKREQIAKYVARYDRVLVTTFRDWVLVERDAQGSPVATERFRLGETEADFWKAVEEPKALSEKVGVRLIEFLQRVMLRAVKLTDPKDVAWMLAGYARDARFRVERQRALPALAAVRSSLEDSLGISFEGDRGEHFFRSTLVQTLFYGIFSAWTLWAQEHGEARFDWHTAVWHLRIPVLSGLFAQIAVPSRIDQLKLVEVLDWAGESLNRVDQKAFFTRFTQEHAIQYFYEPFLEAFDPSLRKSLGVWYTPPEVVRYMVARVDGALRDQLGIEDGLADPRVLVLDPCCGTGAFLVEVLEQIARTLREQRGESDLMVAAAVEAAAAERIFGFEILTAPFVIAHMQLGLLLNRLGMHLNEDTTARRAGVFLTNALTGWDTSETKRQIVAVPELQTERDEADSIKRDKRIIVVLGNPPYNAFAGVSAEGEHGAVDVYKEGLITRWKIKKFNLDDLYIRFFRLAERRIAEISGIGIVSFITNFSYLADPSFVVMRERFLAEFDDLWFDNLNGDSRETGKRTPAGEPDPSVFSTEYNREGIRKGTAVCLLVRKAVRDLSPAVHYREFWGTNKRAELLNTFTATGLHEYESGEPLTTNWLSFRYATGTPEYRSWPSVPELAAQAPSNGLMEKRGSSLISIDRAVLEERMKAYFDPSITWNEFRALGSNLSEDAAGYDAKKTRAKVLAAERFDPARIVRYAIRPLDDQWAYYSGVSPLWNRSRPALWAQCWEGNRFLLTRFKASKTREGSPFYFSRCLSDDHLLSPDAVAIPVVLRSTLSDAANQASLFTQTVSDVRPNLSVKAQSYLKAIGIPELSVEDADLLWLHCLAIGYSRQYLTENASGIRQNWPRIPLPMDVDALRRSAALGAQIAALLDPEYRVLGITTGNIRPEIRVLGQLVLQNAKQVSSENLCLSAGWGFHSDGVVMPGRGQMIERPWEDSEASAFTSGATTHSLSADDAFQLVGNRVLDVYLNDVAYWRCIPIRVWEYTIGGHQVIKKWLSYREHEVFGRALTLSEVGYVTDMVRRITAILLLEPELDASYQAVREAPFAWPTS